MSIEELLKRAEDHRLEFKRELANPEDLAKELVAFSNTKGGKIVVGVDDKTKEVVGIDLTKDWEEFIMNVATHNCNPIISPLVEFHSIKGKTIVIIEVFPGRFKPYFVLREGQEKGVYIRIGSTNRRADKNWLGELSRQSRNITFDRVEIIEADFNDFDTDRVEFYQERRRDKLGTPLEKITEEYLEKIGAMKRFNNKRFPTIGGLLLFGKEPQVATSLLRAVIKIARFKGVKKGVFLDQTLIDGTLPEQIDQAEIFIARNIRLGGVIKGFLREDIYEYPPQAFRELITNAVVHRDYFLASNKAIYIEIYNDRIEVISPGILPQGVEIDNIYHMQNSRNPLIARRMFEMNYLEEWGQGLDTIRDLLTNRNLPEPKFKEIGDEFRVTLFGPGENFMI